HVRLQTGGAQTHTTHAHAHIRTPNVVYSIILLLNHDLAVAGVVAALIIVVVTAVTQSADPIRRTDAGRTATDPTWRTNIGRT
uniref:Uncharacterized protein n=1 Tax=Triticum urartu TaxID=4572 RepID=A0A8R7UFA1_TRIUA